MTWLQRYRVWSYTRTAIWIFPVLGMMAALGGVRLLDRIDEQLAWESGVHPDTARAVLGALASSMFTFIVFICSALLVVVQLASSAYAPHHRRCDERPGHQTGLDRVCFHLHASRWRPWSESEPRSPFSRPT